MEQKSASLKTKIDEKLMMFSHAFELTYRINSFNLRHGTLGSGNFAWKANVKLRSIESIQAVHFGAFDESETSDVVDDRSIL